MSKTYFRQIRSKLFFLVLHYYYIFCRTLQFSANIIQFVTPCSFLVGNYSDLPHYSCLLLHPVFLLTCFLFYHTLYISPTTLYLDTIIYFETYCSSPILLQILSFYNILTPCTSPYTTYFIYYETPCISSLLLYILNPPVSLHCGVM